MRRLVLLPALLLASACEQPLDPVLDVSQAAVMSPDVLEVLPNDYDFGDVQVGTTVTTIVSLTNIDGSDVEVLGAHEQFHVLDGPVDVKVAGEPALFGGKVAAALQTDLDGEVPDTDAIARAEAGALDALVVQKRAVRASLVLKEEPFHLVQDLGMVLRHLHRAQLDLVRVMTAEPHPEGIGEIERMDLPLGNELQNELVSR